MFPTQLKIAAALLLTLGAGLLMAQPAPQDKSAAPPAARAAEPEKTNAVGHGPESPLPTGAFARLGTSRFRHVFNVRSLAFSPDGKVIASGSQKNTIRLWDVETGEELKVLTGHTGGVIGLCFSPDGKTLASSSWDRSIRLWDVATGNEVRRINGHQGGVNSITFSPDGKELLSASGDGTARLWDAATGGEVRQFQGHEGPVEVASFSRDGKRIATGGQDNKARLWDAATGKELRKFEGPGSPVESVVFSPEGKRLAVMARGGTARVWLLAGDDQPLAINTGASAHLWASAFSADGRLLATATRGVSPVKAAVRVWDVTTGKERARFVGHQETAAGLGFSADGRVLASGGCDGTVLLWDLTGRAEKGKFVAAELTPPALEADWTDLLSDDGMKVQRAAWALAAAPKQALPLLRDVLKPVSPADERRVAQLIKELDADDFDAREKATAELEKIGEPAAPALRKALEGTPTAELRVRATSLLEKFGGKVVSADVLRRERAMEVLEHMGAEARVVLEEIAKGAPEAALTQEAKAALKRLR